MMTASLVQGNDEVAEAMSALQVLGYTRRECEQAFEKMDTSRLGVEEMIKAALKNLAR